MMESLERPLSKTLQRGEDPHFDQLLSAFGEVCSHYILDPLVIQKKLVIFIKKNFLSFIRFYINWNLETNSIP